MGDHTIGREWVYNMGVYGCLLDSCDAIKLFLHRAFQAIFHQLTSQKDLKVLFLALGMMVENEITVSNCFSTTNILRFSKSDSFEGIITTKVFVQVQQTLVGSTMFKSHCFKCSLNFRIRFGGWLN